MKQIYEKGCIEKFNKKNGLIICFKSGFETELKNYLLRKKIAFLFLIKLGRCFFLFDNIKFSKTCIC